MLNKQAIKITEAALEQIVDSPVPVFELQSVMKRLSLLRLAANALDVAEPETAENLRLAHLLASWANQLDSAQPLDAECDCGHVRRECICNQQAAEHFLKTGDGSRLIGLGWRQNVLTDLENGEVTPAFLLTVEGKTMYQKGATPADIRHQSMW